jgi:hypothetical protein
MDVGSRAEKGSEELRDNGYSTLSQRATALHNQPFRADTPSPNF